MATKTSKFVVGPQDDIDYLSESGLSEKEALDYATQNLNDNGNDEGDYQTIYKLVPYAKVEVSNHKVVYLDKEVKTTKK